MHLHFLFLSRDERDEQVQSIAQKSGTPLFPNWSDCCALLPSLENNPRGWILVHLQWEKADNSKRALAYFITLNVLMTVKNFSQIWNDLRVLSISYAFSKEFWYKDNLMLSCTKNLQSCKVRSLNLFLFLPLLAWIRQLFPIPALATSSPFPTQASSCRQIEWLKPKRYCQLSRQRLTDNL